MSVSLVALAASAFGLLVGTVLTASRPMAPVPGLDGYFDRWSPLHGGYDLRTGNPWLRGWLVMSYHLARPLARRGVKPDALTLWGLWLALTVVVLAQAGGRWPVLAGLVLVVSGLGDTLDGCVAVLTDRATRFGYVVDSAMDRVNDVFYLVAVVAVGASVPLAVTCGVGFFLLEYIRARGSNAGAGDIGTVTVGERANRVIILALTLIGSGVLVDSAALAATAGLAVMTLLTAVGVVQITLAVRRRLAGLPGPVEQR